MCTILRIRVFILQLEKCRISISVIRKTNPELLYNIVSNSSLGMEDFKAINGGNYNFKANYKLKFIMNRKFSGEK